MKVLILESSLLAAQLSASRRICRELVEHLTAGSRSAVVVRRDLAAEPPGHASLDLIVGWTKSSESRTEREAQAVAASEVLIAELFAADVLVIGAPMYNFSVPSPLKAWIDNIAIAGQTFRYTPEGRLEGLVRGKRLFLVASRGGLYSDGPMAAFNFQDTYLRAVLGFLGMTDITVISAEQQKMGQEAQAVGFERALRQVEAVALPASASTQGAWQ